MTTTSTAAAVPEAPHDGRASGVGGAGAAAVVGGLFAAVSGSWALGGTWLLDTVGGSLEAGGRDGSAAVLALVWAAVVAKTVAVAVPWAAVRTPAGRRRRFLRRVAWVEAVVLTGYGAVLTTVGLLVQTGVVPTDDDADHRALAWHTFLWDPWFLVWGVLVTLALVRSRVAGSRPG